MLGLGVILGADQHGGGAVGERRGGAGRDRAVLVEGGLQSGERFRRGFGRGCSHPVTSPFFVLNGDDFVAEIAGGLRGGGALLRAHAQTLPARARLICHLLATFSAVSPMPM